MQRKKVVLIAVGILLVIILISVILRFSVFDSTNPFKPLPTFENAKSLQENPLKLDPVLPLPVSYNHPALRGAVVNYIFEGNLKEIKGKTPALELVTDIQITDGPTFITNKDTLYFTEIKGVKTPTSKLNLKPGQKIKIAIYYDLYRKTWILTGVAIVKD